MARGTLRNFGFRNIKNFEIAASQESLLAMTPDGVFSTLHSCLSGHVPEISSYAVQALFICIFVINRLLFAANTSIQERDAHETEPFLPVCTIHSALIPPFRMRNHFSSCCRREQPFSGCRFGSAKSIGQ
jgi:hypothetical protein